MGRREGEGWQAPSGGGGVQAQEPREGWVAGGHGVQARGLRVGGA